VFGDGVTFAPVLVYMFVPWATVVKPVENIKDIFCPSCPSSNCVTVVEPVLPTLPHVQPFTDGVVSKSTVLTKNIGVARPKVEAHVVPPVQV
jgi:hypothetical protein